MQWFVFIFLRFDFMSFDIIARALLRFIKLSVKSGVIVLHKIYSIYTFTLPFNFYDTARKQKQEMV